MRTRPLAKLQKVDCRHESPDSEFVRVLLYKSKANSAFFMQYILIAALLSLPLQLLRVADILVACIVRPIFCGASKTRREKMRGLSGCHTFTSRRPFFHS